jgi:hypothetical protein
MACETAMTNAVRNLITDRQKVENNKQKYIQTANQQVQSFTEQMRNQFSSQTQYLRDNLQKINQAFNALGETGLGIDLQNMDREDLQAGPPDGLYGMPQDILKLIGGGAKPPMISMDSFARSIGGIGSAVERLEEKKRTVVEAQSKLDVAKAACTKQDIENALGKLKNAVNAFTDAKCTSNISVCDKTGQAALTDLFGTIGEISVEVGGEALESITGQLEGVGDCTDLDRVISDAVDQQQDSLNNQILNVNSQIQLEKRETPPGDTTLLEEQKRALMEKRNRVRDKVEQQYSNANIYNRCMSIAKNVDKAKRATFGAIERSNKANDAN